MSLRSESKLEMMSDLKSGDMDAIREGKFNPDVDGADIETLGSGGGWHF